MNLDGVRVVVTGGSSGIGEKTGRLFAQRGSEVVVLARSAEALDRVVKEIRAAGGRAHAYPVDLADLDQVAVVSRRILTEVGPVDVLVNNAGAGRWLAIEETDPHEALAMTMVPYLGAFAMTRGLIEPMLARRRGMVINVTSPAAVTPFPGAVAYSVARGAMLHFTRALQADLHGTGVRAATVMPSEVDSPYFDHNPGSKRRIPRISKLVGTIGPQDVAEAIVRVAERDSRGATLPWQLTAVRALHAVVPGVVTGVIRTTGWKRPEQLATQARAESDTAESPAAEGPQVGRSEAIPVLGEGDSPAPVP
jgi:short-subunit dehydrogenase